MAAKKKSADKSTPKAGDGQDDTKQPEAPATKKTKAAEKEDAPAKEKPRAKFKVTATRTGYFDLERRRPGSTFYMDMEIDKNDEPVNMPTWVVLAKDYVPEEDESDKPAAAKRVAPDVIRL